MSKSEVKTEWRIVCHGSGSPGHADHVFSYTEEKVARKMLDKRTREWGAKPATQMCSPFHLESRLISAWSEVKDDGR